MRRVRLSVAVSLGGYSGGPNGHSDWIVMDPDIDFGELMGAFDTVLLGRKSYEAAGQHGGFGMPGMNTFVFSRNLRQEDCPNATVSDSPAEVVGRLKKESGKDIWLFGGGELFGSMLDLRLVDSIELAVIPVLLGGGVRLLPDDSERTKLKLVNHRVYPKTGTVWLEYAPS